MAEGLAEVEPRRVVLRMGASSRVDDPQRQCLEVLPQSDMDMVRAVLRRLGVRGSESVRLSAGSLPLWQYLLEQCDLSRISEPMLELVRESAPDRRRRQNLERWVRGATRAARVPSVLDWLETLREPPPLAPFLDRLEPLRPRCYAPASTFSWDPNRVELLVWPVVSASGGREQRGVASDYLCRVVRAGDRLRVRWHAVPLLSVPAASHTPLVFLSAGTGIARVRPLLQSLAERPLPAPETWLILDGDGRRRPHLFEAACRAELRAWQQTGVVRRYSRCAPPLRSRLPPLVGQLEQQRRRLERLVAQRSIFYLVGEMGSQAEHVLTLLRQTLQRVEGLTADAANQELEHWRDSGRLQEHRYLR